MIPICSITLDTRPVQVIRSLQIPYPAAPVLVSEPPDDGTTLLAIAGDGVQLALRSMDAGDLRKNVCQQALLPELLLDGTSIPSRQCRALP